MNTFKSLVKQNKHKSVTGIISLLAIVALFVLASFLFRNYQPNIEEIIGVKSLLGMALFVAVFILSIVFTPVSAMPIIPIGTRLWGIAISTALSVTGWTIGAMIAFNLARKFGRPYVSKIVSLEKIEKVEKFIPEKNIFWAIFFFRAVTPFDGLSYILGLITKISPRTYFWATLLGLIPFCLTMSYLGSLPTIFLIVSLIIASLFCIIGIIGIEKKIY